MGDHPVQKIYGMTTITNLQIKCVRARMHEFLASRHCCCCYAVLCCAMCCCGLLLLLYQVRICGAFSHNKVSPLCSLLGISHPPPMSGKTKYSMDSSRQ